MKRHYDTCFSEIADGKDWRIQDLSFANEIVYIVEKNIDISS